MTCVLGAVLAGVDGVPVEVEVRISSLLPRIDIVGLPEAAVRESAARVRAAITTAGHRFPERRVTVNLAPASLRKAGAGLDLPIALGIVCASAAAPEEHLGGLGLVGELALDGRLRPVRGALALAIALRDAGCTQVVVPRANAREAALAPKLRVSGADTLSDVIRYLTTGEALDAVVPFAASSAADRGPDLADVRGQAQARRALEVAAAGGHGLLLRGPPGTGKTMLARRLPGLLPALDFDECLEATRIHGACGLLDPDAPILAARPFRAPHHSASRAGLLGGGSPPRPGEVSLAHRGVLFLDELPEFERRSLEALRQVIEERRVAIARASGTCLFPADFQLVAACNPCPCGWRLSRWRDCTCRDEAIARYAARMSGPLIDRIDLHLDVPAVRWAELDVPASGEATSVVRARVQAARARQSANLQRAAVPARTNAEIPDAELDARVDATPEARTLLGRAVEHLRLSARGARRMLRVARTIADLADEDRVGPPAMAEALSYRAADPAGS